MNDQDKLTSRLMRCVTVTVGKGTSDFDLNPAGPVRDRPLTPAAVLIGIRPAPDGPVVVLTKRTSALKHHPGQIAFPGGKRDAHDVDLTATALREATEEIGLPEGQVTPLGTLDIHETVTGFAVTPVLALIDPAFQPKPEPGEVDQVFDVPFDMLMDAQYTRIEGRMWHGQKRFYYVMPFGPFYIWGATARMIVALRSAWDATA